MAAYACEQILKEVRTSCLNFVISETPYSANICLRKRFLKEVSPQQSPKEPDLNSSQHPVLRLEEENAALRIELETVLSKAQELKEQGELDKDMINTFQTKVEQSESELYDYMKKNKSTVNDKVEELKVLKGILKNKDEEISRNKIEINKLGKEAKIHEKEIYNLETENENLKISNKKVKALKKENATLVAKIANREIGDMATPVVEKDVIIYKVETNNNFDILGNQVNTSVNDATEEEKTLELKVNPSNYKKNLISFLENFKENESELPKYPKDVKFVIEKGYNVFHISLLDIGNFDPNLKGFMARHHKNLSTEILDLVKTFGESLKFGKFADSLSVYINKRNYGQ